MKIAVSALGPDLSSSIDPRFGCCRFLVFSDMDTGDWEAVENENVDASCGAGIRTAQMVIDRKAAAVITGNIGPALVCLNKSDLNREVAEDIARFCRHCGVQQAAEIPFDPGVVEALRRVLLPIGNVPAQVEKPLRELASVVTGHLGI